MDDVGGLERNRCADGIRCPGKLGNECITSNFVGGARVVVDDLRESMKGIANAFVGQSFVALHEPGRLGNVGMEYDGQFAQGRFCHDGEVWSFGLWARTSRY